MKALSIRQPWAWAIMHAGKDIENRDWPTAWRGRVLIHAGKSVRDEEIRACAAHARRRLIELPAVTVGELRAQAGMILGSVEVVDCVTRSDSPWFVGKYGFVLRHPRPFATPIPWKGALGFFDVPDHLVPGGA